MRIQKKERGQSLVELAISLTVLLFLLSGVAEFGVIFFKYIQLRDAAQEGALYASLYPQKADEIRARIRYSSTSPINLVNNDYYTGARINILFPGSGNLCVQDEVKIEVVHRHRIFMPFMPRLLGRQWIELNASVTDVILQTESPSPPC